MTVAYATEADLEAFLPSGTVVDDAERLLERASEVIDDYVRQPFEVGSDQLPTDPKIAQALKDATCAQVEYWAIGPGEEHDVEGMANRGVSIGHLRVDALPPELAPRAARFLRQQGLTTIGGRDPLRELV